MAGRAVAFCPGHISGYFRRLDGDCAATTGSTGAGIVLSEGVSATAVPADRPSVEIRRLDAAGNIVTRLSGAAPLEHAMAHLGVAAAITTECRLPLQAGYGLSAAALLAGIAAVDALFDIGLGTGRIALLAHETDVLFRSGLGDVAACQGGGLECRHGAGTTAPITRWHDLCGPLAAVTLGTLATASVLGSPEAMARVAAAYPGRCPRDIDDFFRLSRGFAEKSGLIAPAVATVLAACDRAGIPASMTMLGNGVFAYGSGSERALAPFGDVMTMEIATEGFRVLEAPA